ncbi:MAG: serine protease [Pseudomonadota bacterium]
MRRHFAIKSFRCFSAAPLLAWVCLTMLSLDAVGAKAGMPAEEFMTSRAVRVEVRGPNVNVSASGFLWKRDDQIITSLHAIPLSGKIIVKCGNAVKLATLSKILPRADLALLTVNPSASGAQGLAPCVPFQAAHVEDPPLNTALYAYGWHSDSRQGQPIEMRRGSGGPLQDLVPSRVVEAVREFGIPSISEQIYAMRNGSLPGYSGALVVDSAGRLIGVVDGGLNDGAAGFTWAIPSRYLAELERQPVVTERTARAAVPKWLYSTAPADPVRGSVIAYAETDVMSGENFHYRWYHTKTMALTELARSSSDPAGLVALFETYGQGINPAALRFDIYEDLGFGLIIAVPAGQPLIFEEVGDNPGFHWLKSEPADPNKGHIQFRQTTWSVSDGSNPDRQINPSEPGFFNQKVAELLAECNQPGESRCRLDPDSLRMLHFANGNKILRVGFGIRWNEGWYAYDYYSIAVRGNVAFRAFLRFFDDEAGGPGPCPGEPQRVCANPDPLQLAQMLAVQLTTFANLGTTTGGREETSFHYDRSADSPDTIGIGYFQGDRLRFYNSRGKIWINYEYQSDFPGDPNASDTTNEYVEYDRDDGFVYLNYGDISVAVPIQGGDFHVWDQATETWQPGPYPLRRGS